MRFVYFSLLGFLLFFGIGILGGTAKAASFGISSSAKLFEVGKTYSVRVIVASPDQSINALSGTIVATKNVLEIVSVDSAGSVVRFWTREPTVQKNQVRFEGVVLNPGFKGSVGRILTIRLRAKSPGEGTITFSSGVVLANDGKGTKLPLSLGSLPVTIKQSESEEVKKVEPPREEQRQEQGNQQEEASIGGRLTASSLLEDEVESEEELTPFSISEPAPWVTEALSDELEVESPSEITHRSWVDDLSNWWAGLAAFFVSTTLLLARFGGGRFGFIAAIRRRRKVRDMNNRVFQLLLQWDENLERQHQRLKRAAKQRELTAVEKQTLRDIEKNQVRMHELGDLITELPKPKK